MRGIKFTQTEVENIFAESGCVFDDVYIDALTIYNYICKCGNRSKTNFNNFKHNKRQCSKCSGTAKKTIEDVRKHASIDGTVCISDIYINSYTNLQFKCPEGDIYEMRWDCFKAGQRCRHCNYRNRIGSNHPLWTPDRTRIVRSKYLQFDLKNTHLLKDDPNYELLLESRKTTNRFKKNEFSVDHIFPRIAFVDNDLDIKYGPDVVKNICNLRENLQILKREENGNKSGKYNQEEFMKWFEEKLNT